MIKTRSCNEDMLLVFLLNISPTCNVNFLNSFLLRKLYEKVIKGMKGKEKNIDDEMFIVDVLLGYIYVRLIQPVCVTHTFGMCDSYNLYG